jgi:eukaryotic-like serine/threonine-protein kinase
MVWIELRERGKPPKRFNLPKYLPQEDGTSFQIFHAVRQGGNGVVFDARHLKSDGSLLRTCAVKMLKERDDVRIDRFNNEVRVLESLDNPRISAAFGSGTVTLGSYDVPWVAMELGGTNLQNHLDQNGPLNSDILMYILLQMVDALEHLHDQGFIHRDIKPSNFVWDFDNENILMIDFGLAKRIGEDVSGRPLDDFTRSTEFVGPVFFSSPELIAYASNKATLVDHRSDIFQLGKVAWFLATGTISAGVPSRRLCKMNGKLWDIVMLLLADDPDDRPSSAKEVRELLQTLPH